MCIFDELNAEWIWYPQDKEVINQYIDFRHEFNLTKVDSCAILYISIDTEYAVLINGIFVDCGQYDDYPNHKSYDMLDIGKYLKPGSNVLCILGYYQGENSFQYVKGRPGLIYALKVGEDKVISGCDAFCRQSAAYRNGQIAKISPQLAFSFEFNAAKDDGWLQNDYSITNGWKMAQVNKNSKAYIELYKRPVQKLDIGKTIKGNIIAQGQFIRKDSEGKELTTAEKIQSDYLSSRIASEIFPENSVDDLNFPSKGIYITKKSGNEGIYLLIDLMREEAGLFELELEGEEGVTIEAAYGQHVDDLRVRASVGGRNFANKYVCKDGLQKFTHYFRRISGRYIQLHIGGIKKQITIYYAGIRPAKYPLEDKGVFSCNDRLLNKIYDVSVRTLELCMHEHYEDTPWREQGMYAMDSRNQALCGYYCFGEYDFAESSLTLLGESLGEDGMLEICAPAEDIFKIPSFSLGWIIALADFVLYSGRVETGRKLFPKVKIILDTFMSNMENGISIAPMDQRYWNFYDWSDGLDDGWLFEPPFEKGKKRYDAPLNLFLCLALKAAAKLAKWSYNSKDEKCYTECLNKLRKAVHKEFWDDAKQAYRTYTGVNCKEHYAELTQALALCCKVVPQKKEKLLRKKLSENDNVLVKTTLSYAIYKYEALLQESEKYGYIVFDAIAEGWGYMLYNKATSFWETIKGADDFDKAGSLCHGWSAIPVYFLSAYILGIRPKEPGFSKFSALPLPGVKGYAFGKVPTPHGDITVQWKMGSKDEYMITYPENTIRV